MKRSIFFIAFFTFLFCCRIFAVEVIVIIKDPPPSPLPNSIIHKLPTRATVSEVQLPVSTETTIGNATITVYDESGQVVYQETVSADSISDLFIEAEAWSTGNYSVTITCSTAS